MSVSNAITPEILGEFKTIIAATSLEDAGSGMPEDQ